MIDDIRLSRLAVPLAAPYKLAFGAVTRFDTILVRLTVQGREGLGEATILNGYTDETIEQVWPRAMALARRLPGLSAAAARNLIDRDLPDAPFTATGFLSAVEMGDNHPVLSVQESVRVPLLFGVNAADPAGIEAEIDAALAQGYGTLKIKVGFAVEADLQRVRLIQRVNRGRATLRIDANQGYSRDEACVFARNLDPESIELLEQPCAAEDWDGLEAVAKVSAIPLMLDESIYHERDIERAAGIGASFVKLKLMKFGSLGRLEAGLQRIRALGMEPVLGNGVASDLGCWMEACVARRHIRNAGEMNGFLRQRRSLANPPMRVSTGAIELQPGWRPRLDPERLREVTIETIAIAGDDPGMKVPA